MITYCLACLVLNTGYEGNLKSHLSAIKLPPPLKTLKEFAEDGTYENILFIAPDVKEIEGYFQIIPGLEHIPEEHPILFLGIPLNELFYKTLEGQALVGSRTLFRIAIVTQLTNKFGITKVQIVDEMMTLYSISFKQARMNKFSNHMNRRIGQWIEGGLFAAQMKWEIERSNKIPLEVDDKEYVSDKSSIFNPLKLDMFRLLWGFYGCGTGSAFTVFLIELMAKRKHKRSPKIFRKVGNF